MRKASSARGRGQGTVRYDRLLRPISRHPAYWDAGQPGNNMSILFDHEKRIVSGP